MAEDPGYRDIQLEIDDLVALIRLNRSDRLNAFTYRTLRELRGAIDSAAADQRGVGIVIIGNGVRALSLVTPGPNGFVEQLQGTILDEHRHVECAGIMRRTGAFPWAALHIPKGLRFPFWEPWMWRARPGSRRSGPPAWIPCGGDFSTISS